MLSTIHAKAATARQCFAGGITSGFETVPCIAATPDDRATMSLNGWQQGYGHAGDGCSMGEI
jgi:hypothetical protein